MAYSKRKLDLHLKSLGYEERYQGTEDIREAVGILSDNPRACFSKEVYPTIAAAAGTDPKAVERRIRAATRQAMSSECWAVAWRGIGGAAKPTNMEIVRRLARECDLED